MEKNNSYALKGLQTNDLYYKNDVFILIKV